MSDHKMECYRCGGKFASYWDHKDHDCSPTPEIRAHEAREKITELKDALKKVAELTRYRGSEDEIWALVESLTDWKWGGR